MYVSHFLFFPLELKKAQKDKTYVKYAPNLTISGLSLHIFSVKPVLSSIFSINVPHGHLHDTPDGFKIFIGNLKMEDTNICYDFQKHFPLSSLIWYLLHIMEALVSFM